MSTDHYTRLEHAYRAAPCNESIRPTMTISQGSAVVRFDIRPEMFHAMRAVHGAFYFKALDDAAFFAANSVVTDVFVLTVSFTVQFLRPIADGVLIAEGRLVKEGTLLFAESVLTNADGRQLARGTGVFARGRQEIVPR